MIDYLVTFQYSPLNDSYINLSSTVVTRHSEITSSKDLYEITCELTEALEAKNINIVGYIPMIKHKTIWDEWKNILLFCIICSISISIGITMFSACIGFGVAIGNFLYNIVYDFIGG